MFDSLYRVTNIFMTLSIVDWSCISIWHQVLKRQLYDYCDLKNPSKQFKDGTDLTQWDERCCSDESHRCIGAVWCSDNYSAHPRVGHPECTRLPWMWWDISVLEKSKWAWTTAFVCLLCPIKTIKIKNLFTPPQARISPQICRFESHSEENLQKHFLTHTWELTE